MRNKKGNITVIAIIGAALVLLIIVLGTLWIGQSAGKDTKKVAQSVSLLYLDELAGRREQVVSDNIQRRIGDMYTALELMTEEDFSDEDHLKQYQAKMKRLFTLQKFAFVNEDGLEATRTIRAMDREDAKSIPIIALTANAFDEDVQRSMQAGLNAHLSKPVQPEALFETLSGLIK